MLAGVTSQNLVDQCSGVNCLRAAIRPAGPAPIIATDFFDIVPGYKQWDEENVYGFYMVTGEDMFN